MAISFVAFMVLYSLAPARRLRFGTVLPGALAAAGLFELSKLSFSIYLESFAAHEVVYGSLGVIVAFFLWTYISATILLFGAEVVSEYPKVASLQYDRDESPAGTSQSMRQRLSRYFRSLVTRD